MLCINLLSKVRAANGEHGLCVIWCWSVGCILRCWAACECQMTASSEDVMVDAIAGVLLATESHTGNLKPLILASLASLCNDKAFFSSAVLRI